MGNLDVNKVIGGLVIYALIDVYSRIVTELYVGLEGPSWIGTMMALGNMFTDKVGFYKGYVIEILEEQWPIYCLPEIILVNRGELKGIVECKFRTFNGKVKQKIPCAI